MVRLFIDSNNDGTFTGTLKSSVTYTMNSGVDFTTTAAKVTGQTITGSGTLTITSLHDTLDANLNNISITNATAQWSDNSSGSAAFTGTLYGTAISTRKVTITSSKTMKTTAAKITGHYIDSTGTLSVTDLASTLDCTFTNISCATLFTDSSNDGTFTGTLKSGVTYTVNSGVDITTTAAKISGKTIAGQGTLTITNLQDTLDANLTNISITNAATQWSDNSSGSAAFTGTLYGTAASTRTVAIAENKTMKTTAAKVTSQYINDSGTLTITDLQDTLAANLTNITVTNATAQWSDNSSGSAAFTGTLYGTAASTRKITITAGKTMKTTAAKVTGHYIDSSGTLSVTDLSSTLDCNFTNISCATLFIDSNNDGTFTGTLKSSVTYTMNSGVDFTTTAAKVTGQTITGSGTLTITSLHDTLDANLNNISITNATAQWSDNSSGSAAFTGTLYGTAISTRKVTITSSKTMKTTAAKITGHYIDSTGTLSVTDLASTLDCNLSNISCATLLTDASNDGTFTGSFKTGVTYTINSGVEITSTAAIVNGKTISGTGTITIIDLDNSTSADLLNINSSIVNMTIDQSLTFTGKLPQSASSKTITITISNTKILTLSGTLSNGTFTHSLKNSLTNDGITFTGSADSAKVIIKLTNASDAILAGDFSKATFNTISSELRISVACTFTGTIGNALGTNAKDTIKIDGFELTINANKLTGLSIGSVSNSSNDSINITNLQDKLDGDFSNTSISNGTVTYNFTSANNTSFSGKLKTDSDTIKLNVGTNLELNIAESAIKEVVRYVDSGVSLSEKDVKKTGQGTLILANSSPSDRTYFTNENVSPLSGEGFTDSSLDSSSIKYFISTISSGNVVAVDTKPTITGVSLASNNSTIAVTMSEAVYNTIAGSGNLEVSDFVFSISGGNATLSSTTPSSISINGNVYTLGISLSGTPNGSETLTVNPASSAIYDVAGNSALTNQSNNSITLYDKLAPTMTISSSTVNSSETSNDSTISLTFTSSESTSNFIKDDITISDGNLSSLSGSGTTYTATLTPSGDATYTISVAQNKFTDSAGNNNSVSNTFSWTYDSTAPIITGVTLASDNTTIAVTFSEAVYNTNSGSGSLEVSDFVFGLSGGTASLLSTTPSSISINGNVYTLGISLSGTPDGNETLTVNPVSTSIYDAVGNVASTSQSNNSVNLN